MITSEDPLRLRLTGTAKQHLQVSVRQGDALALGVSDRQDHRHGLLVQSLGPAVLPGMASKPYLAYMPTWAGIHSRSSRSFFRFNAVATRARTRNFGNARAAVTRANHQPAQFSRPLSGVQEFAGLLSELGGLQDGQRGEVAFPQRCCSKPV